jgi:hypothetical protein
MYIDDNGKLHVGENEIPGADHLLDCEFSDPKLMGSCTDAEATKDDIAQSHRDLAEKEDSLCERELAVQQRIARLGKLEQRLNNQKLEQDAVAEYLTRLLSGSLNHNSNSHKKD